MSKAVINGETWRRRSASHSTHGSSRGVNLLNWDLIAQEVLSLEQQRESLLQALRSTEQSRAMLDAESDEYARAGGRIAYISRQLSEIKAKGTVAKRYQNLSDHLIKMFKDRVTPTEWKAIVAEARRLHDNQECLSELQALFGDSVVAEVRRG
ncbi:hypothetical protein [Pararobbsia silviterrae]|uniref:Uncharacterized protein n=1 Tax=Pararobbsia silviterrae TaxID=1792498 RepID=A0A494Y943_9BURK|nr:hypothetical protein [Pararobbsia silviterrae]RKP58635.1 hypothetical protein D7S86_01440 [Pararobbsia silviterrae]